MEATVLNLPGFRSRPWAPLWPGQAGLALLWTLAKIVLILAPLLLSVAYLTFWERKIIGWMQVRIGPNRVGPWGCCNPLPTA
jgi:NADH-quinone oxidoreductase subunit H